jgi:hypothetical protein
MRPLTNPKASNWVDRGEPATPVLMRILAFHFDRDLLADATWLSDQAVIVEGMVEADGTEVTIARYLQTLEPAEAPTHNHYERRTAGVALWHVAKVALLRDLATRMLDEGMPRPTSDSAGLAVWLATRLTPEDRAAGENPDGQ